MLFTNIIDRDTLKASSKNGVQGVNHPDGNDVYLSIFVSSLLFDFLSHHHPLKLSSLLSPSFRTSIFFLSSITSADVFVSFLLFSSNLSSYYLIASFYLHIYLPPPLCFCFLLLAFTYIIKPFYLIHDLR